MKRTPITDAVMEQVMREFSHGNFALGYTGTRYGLSLREWDWLILDELLEYKQGLPRCIRNCKWNSQQRLDEINKHEVNNEQE